MRFSPIAIVGRACLLPGADSPRALWRAVREGADLLDELPREAPEIAASTGRWRIDPARVLREGSDPTDATWTTRGGHVQAFEPEPSLEGLDALFHWVLRTARGALEDAGFTAASHPRAGAVLGNLSFPTCEMSRFAEAVWSGAPRPDPRNRFMSGLPALLLEEALALDAGAFALDAACASSLYAIKHAADALHDGRADLMLAGAVNRADDLFLHMGFAALQALSPTGRSRPFDAGADGLVPAEGAGFVALMRFADARASGRRIHGVIRGVGLSNDGRGGGLLSPSAEGQLRAMRAAWGQSGWNPGDLGYLECHATGTAVGDRVEIQSATGIFSAEALRGRKLPIGSLKSNLGHLITAAGIAGLIKVLEAMEAGELPPMRPPERPLKELAGAPLRLVTAPEPWVGPRRAAVSAFGFGGNDAHLLVEADAWEIPETSPARPRRDVAIVGLGVVVGEAVGAAALAEAVSRGTPLTRCAEVTLPLTGLRFPPRDLDVTLPQQVLMLQAALEAAPDLAPSERAGVFVGMGTDPNVCRYGWRWRTGDRDAVPALGSAGVVGNMPNIVANRLNACFDLGGASTTVSAEERSGLVALALAARAVSHGELDEALVGAVDLCCDAVHEAATPGRTPADAAVCLLLRPADEARRRGEPILALLGGEGGEPLSLPSEIGHAHAAEALVRIAVALVTPHAPGRVVHIEVKDLLGGTDGVTLTLLRPAGGRLRALGPTRSWPAHAEVPRPVARGVVLPAPAPQRMEPAPWLPPVIAPDEPSLAVGGTVPPAPSSPAPRDAVIALLRAHLARVTEIHRAWIAEQAALHERFLALQAHGHALLMRGPGASPTSDVAVMGSKHEEGPSPRVDLPGGARPLPWDRAALRVHAGGRISDLFGPAFASQDAFVRQVRMPEPPLLLADRVTALDAEPGGLQRGRGGGSVLTETDVGPDAWYLHQGHMPAGVMIEAGQADLLLISYLGVDALNQGERVYRLLACDLTYRGGLPRVGDTLRYDIHVDGHASHGDVRLFFFHYDCVVGAAPRLLVRNGQAGFFTEAELDASGGVLWSLETGERTPSPRLDPPRVAGPPREIDAAGLQALCEGRPWEAFGPGFDRAKVHTRGPRVQGGGMLLLRRVTRLDHGGRDEPGAGGPWGRGYLRAEWDFSADDWFFGGHFKNDPCMPGTLMFEGCLQAMAVYLLSLGHALDHDGWRFEPVPDHACHLVCRGQATPRSRRLVYEVFVDEVHERLDGHPTLFADLLCTVDGLPAFHARRMGLRLVPDWPLSDPTGPWGSEAAPDPEAAISGSHRFDPRAMLAAALGRPSEAFGPMYLPFDGTRRAARLPGPPYHFMTRVTRIDGEPAVPRPGTRAEVVYEVPEDAWYFAENGGSMPFCVLLEVALQPCGWLASFVGSALASDLDLSFRNLDGEGTLHAEIRPRAGQRLRTRVTLTSLSSNAGITLESFEVTLEREGETVYSLRTTFGFFPREALENQVGLPEHPEARRLFEAPSNVGFDVGGRWRELPVGANSRHRMLDRVTGWWPGGGRAGLGQMRAEKRLDAGEWFFKAHFFQDPVQPGSLGLEAMIELLQLAMLEQIQGQGQGWTAGAGRVRFEPLALGEPLTWRYRGQVLPENACVTVTLEISSLEREPTGLLARAEASLWVDGKRIYEARSLAMRARWEQA